MVLKANSKKILDIIAGQEAVNATEAYKAVHPKASDNTARNNSSQLLKKPEAEIYLQRHIDKARNRVVKLISSSKEDIALRASEAVLDRALGKALQRSEHKAVSVSLAIDLTGATDKNIHTQ